MPYFSRPSGSFTVSGRAFTALVPNNWRDDVSYPLIIALHSYGATPADIRGRFVIDRGNNFDDGQIIVAPSAVLLDGANLYWNFWDTSAGDFDFLTALIAAVKARFLTSWTGMMAYSNGGFLAIQFSIQHPELVHTLVTMAAAGGTNDPTASTGTPIPRLHIHGTIDGTVLPAGDPLAATLPGILAGHGGANWGSGASTGYVNTATTVSQANARNGGAGTLGAPGTAFDLVTTGTDPESAFENYSGTTSQTAVSRVLCTAANHGLSFSATTETTPPRGINQIMSWMRTNHRTP